MPGLTTSVTKSNQHPGLTTITPRGQHSPPVTSDQCNMNNKFMGVYFEFFYIRCLVNNCQFFIRCFDSEEILITCPQSYLTKSRQALLKKFKKKQNIYYIIMITISSHPFSVFLNVFEIYIPHFLKLRFKILV